MAMRKECKYFESRTYPTGDTVRKCDLDLAPEAPWRCPKDCTSFEPRLADVNWAHGSLITPPAAAPPGSLGEDDSIGALLDEAENIVNAAVPEAMKDVERSNESISGVANNANTLDALWTKLRSFFKRS